MANFVTQDIDFTVTFDAESKRAKVQSNNDFSDFDNMPLITLKGLGRLNDPSGISVFSKLTTADPLINLAIGNTLSAWYNLPVSASGDILNGVYNFLYTINQTGIANGLVVDSITTTTQSAVLPGDRSYLVAGDIVTYSSSSNAGNNGAKTVVSSTYDSLLDQTTVIFQAGSFTNNENGTSGTLAAINVVHTFTKTVEYTYNGCEQVIPCASVNYDCDSTQFGEITFTDKTVLPATQSLVLRAFVVSYPGNLNSPPTPADIQTSLPSITVNNLATGTWTYRLTYDVVVNQTDGLVVTYQSTSGAIEQLVDCGDSICCLLKCVEVMYVKSKSHSNNGAQSPYQQSVTTALVNCFFAKAYKDCGQTEKYKESVAIVKAIIDDSKCDCNCGCDGCSDDGNYWINNAGFESQSLIEQIYNEITLLSTVVASNAQAQAAYNSIVAQINAIFAETLQLVSELAVIEAQASALTGFEENFDDIVNSLEAQTTTVISDVSGVISDLQTLVADIIQFNVDFPSYSSYFVDIINQYVAVANTLNQVDTQANDLLALLQSLTPINFNALIADILSDISDIQQDIQDILIVQGNIVNTLIGVQAIIDILLQQVAQNTADIAALQFLAANDEIFVAQADLNVDVGVISIGAYQILPQYFGGFNDQKGYVKIKVVIEDVNAFTLQIFNDTTAQQLVSEAYPAGSAVVFDVILKWLGPNNFTIAGHVIVNDGSTTEMNTFLEPNISEARILFGQENAFRITSTSSTSKIISSEMIGLIIN